MFKNFDQNRDNFPKCWQKICWFFCQNQDFSKTLSNIKISKHFEENRDVWKLGPELIFSENFDQNRDNFPKCWQKICWFFCQNQDFSKTLSNIKISKHFEENRDVWKLGPELIFSENFDQNQHFRKFGRKSRCSKMKKFSQKRDFSKILTIIDILKKNFQYQVYR